MAFTADHRCPGLSRLGARLAACILLAGATLAAHAQGSSGDHTLALALAQEAAQSAIEACAARNYRVSASVVDVEGVERVFLRGDHSTVHTHETAFKKAYTIATLGPVFGVASTGELVDKIGKSPSGAALVSVSNVILLAGGVAIRHAGETIAALGVGGAPGGQFDEACASAGVARIQARVDLLP